MTAKTFTLDSNGNQRKTPGWYSWRHQTRDAHDEARETYLNSRGPAARRRRAQQRAANGSTLSLEERTARGWCKNATYSRAAVSA